MAIKDKVANAGHAVADAAKTAGEKISKGAENAAEFVKEKTGVGGATEGADLGVGAIKPHMNVIASCGKQVGVVDAVEGSAIKLTRKDSPDDQHHYVPLKWVQRVDNHVHLTMNSKEAEQGWKTDAASCGCSN